MTELDLISVSSKVGEPAECDLFIDVGSKELPDFNLEDCWKKKPITPLRDRLMIEWLFSRHSAKIQAVAIQSQITKLVKKIGVPSADTVPDRWESELEPQTQPKRIRVAISCKNGAQLSPCFVEYLYDSLQFEPPIEGLTVRKHHWDALCGEWGRRRKDIVWQRGRLPVKYTQEVRQAVHNQMWTNFPLHVNSLIEDAFHATPLATSVEIENFKINFEAGTVFEKKKRQVYRIRSTVVSADAFIKCYHLTDQTYKTAVKRYQSAGILFYSIHPLTGEAVFLLGHITYSSCAWCDFGGLRSHWERARYTAARECCEETLGILGSSKSLVKQLEDYKTNNAFKVINEDTSYVSHFLRVRYHDYPAQFQEASEMHQFLEVDDMRWFPMSSIKAAIHMALLDQSHITVNPIHKDGSVDTSRSLSLRTEFVHTMCIAQQLGFLKSIEHIARELHSKNAPPPPPYVSTPTTNGAPRERTEGSSSSSQDEVAHWNDTTHHNTAATGLDNESPGVPSQTEDDGDAKKDSTLGMSTRTNPPTATDDLGTKSESEVVQKIQEVTLESGASGDEEPKRKPLDKPSSDSDVAASSDDCEQTPKIKKDIFYYGMGAGRFMRNAYKNVH